MNNIFLLFILKKLYYFVYFTIHFMMIKLIICSLYLISGLTLRQLNLSSESITLISYPGELFLRTLKLMVLPFIISCLIIGKHIHSIYSKLILIFIIKTVRIIKFDNNKITYKVYVHV